MSIGDVSDEELMRAAGMPIDNLARQQRRGAGVDKYADPKNLADDELFAAAGIEPGAAPKAAPIRELDMVGGKAVPRSANPQLPPDAITTDELYALGSSPQTLRANLAAQHHPGAEPQGPPSEWKQIKDRWTRPIGQQIREIPDDLMRTTALVNRGIDAATLGSYGALRKLIGGAVSPEGQAAANQYEEQVARDMPVTSNAASAVGYLAPIGPANMVGQIAGKVGDAAGGLAARAGARFLERPIAGAVTGAVGAGGVGAAETAAGGGSAQDVGEAALRGAKYGGIAGGAIGTAQGIAGRLAEGADRRISERNIGDFTEGASAARRDRVVGKGGVKYDRIDALARRTPELEAAAGDPIKQQPIVQAQIDRTGAQLDEIYDGVAVRPQSIVNPMREVAAEIRSKPHTGQQAEVANALEREADHVESTWSSYSTKGRERPIQPGSQYTEGTSVGVAPREPTRMVAHDEMRGMGYRERGFEPPAEQGYVDARQARQMVTDYGKGLYGGNPNTPVGIPKAIRQEVYRRQVDQLQKAAEYFKPGVSEELQAANAEMSDWLNINDAVQARASRAATPGMTLKGQAHNILDTALGVLHPGHYLLKKGIEHYGPGAIRGIDQQLSLGGATLQEANPLIRALEAEREQSRRRADAVRNAQLSKKQFDEEERQRRAQEAFQPQEN